LLVLSDGPIEGDDLTTAVTDVAEAILMLVTVVLW